MKEKPQNLFSIKLIILLVWLVLHGLIANAQSDKSDDKNSKKEKQEAKENTENEKEIKKKEKKKKKEKREERRKKRAAKDAEKEKKQEEKIKQREAKEILEEKKEDKKEDKAKDTSNIYKKIKRYSAKRKTTQFLYDLVFTEPYTPLDPSTSNNKSKSNKQKKKDPNAKFVGRTIRSVEIIVYDPFGHSVNDTIQRTTSKLEKLGNRSHVTTRHIVIRNLLLFRKYDKVDILKITESERILRQSTNYVNDAHIYLSGTSDKNDSVDVKVMVLDRWAWDLEALVTSPTDATVSFTDKNLAGLGQQFSQSVDHDFLNSESDFSSQYSINNIRHTYISSLITYRARTDYQQLGTSVSRAFYSPLAKWAGGISGLKTWTKFKYVNADTIPQKAPLESFGTDYWLGRSFHPSKSNTIDNKSRNITLAVRYANTTFQARPGFDIDTNRLNANSSLYLASIGYSVRKFYKDSYIYRFGANEDVPEGWLMQWVYGVLDKEAQKLRYYIGFEVSRGKHYGRFGYISGYFGYGNYFNKSVRNNVVINTGLSYFSNLLKLGRWSMRQFVYYKLIYGINKSAIEQISLSSAEMYGFNAGTKLRGTRKMVLNLETVFYTPYNIIGFRFAPVVLMGFGMVDIEQPRFFYTQIYQSYAAGILFRNENLLFNSFQITFGAYPYTAPGTATHFQLNPIASFSLKISGFATTRPSPVVYQ